MPRLSTVTRQTLVDPTTVVPLVSDHGGVVCHFGGAENCVASGSRRLEGVRHPTYSAL